MSETGARQIAVFRRQEACNAEELRRKAIAALIAHGLGCFRNAIGKNLK